MDAGADVCVVSVHKRVTAAHHDFFAALPPLLPAFFF
jgi:hypothetical protein